MNRLPPDNAILKVQCCGVGRRLAHIQDEHCVCGSATHDDTINPDLNYAIWGSTSEYGSSLQKCQVCASAIATAWQQLPQAYVSLTEVSTNGMCNVGHIKHVC